MGRGGALGNGTMPKSAITPVQVKFPTGIKITSLPSPMPFDTGMAIDTNGDIWGWGANVENSLCVATGNVLYPVKLPLTHVTQASGAGAHALYVSNGKLYACGGTRAASWAMARRSPRQLLCRWSVCRNSQSEQSGHRGRTRVP